MPTKDIIAYISKYFGENNIETNTKSLQEE